MHKYSATEGLYNLFLALNDGPDTGTGIQRLVDITHNIIGPKIPATITSYAVSQQNNITGAYPTPTDVAPSILFCVLFGVTLIAHTAIYIVNLSRGHKFHLSILWIFHSILRIIAFALRVSWAKDNTLVSQGLVSAVFLLIPQVILVSGNLILAQRLFTWRHPVGGSRRLFWNTMIALYCGVVVITAVTILASYVPYLNFLSSKSYQSWQAVVKALSITIILYSLTSVALIGLSYWAPTKKDEKRYTYQPWWIESFSPFYFVQHGAAQSAAETFMKRNSNHRHATRVIAATHHHYDSIEGLTTQRGTLEHNVSLWIISLTTLLVFVGSIVRCIIVFEGKRDEDASSITSPVCMYIIWGVFDFIISVVFIVGRVDLRFYRPDRLPKQVRAIITAEQTYHPSDDEEEYDYEDDGYHSAERNVSIPGAAHSPFAESHSDEWKFVDVDVQSSIAGTGQKITDPKRKSPTEKLAPPYPDKGDADSEFNF